MLLVYPQELLKYKEMTNNLMVTIQCITYNHEPYIRQCLDGFVMQKTNFRFEAIVHDDASTDGTAAIIKEYAEKYPDIIKPIFETENQYSKKDGSLTRIMNEHTHGKYVAICEGDDYWIDPLKLQKQVDFLNSNPDYGMIHTDFNLSCGSRMHTDTNTKETGICFPSILTEGLNVCTCTVMYRMETFLKCPHYYRMHKWPIGDLPLWIELAKEAKIKYIPEVTSIYRILEESASHSKDINKFIQYQNKKIELKEFYAKTYGLKGIENTFKTHFYECIIRDAFELNENEIASSYFFKAKKEKLISKRIFIFYMMSKLSFLKYIYNVYRKHKW